MKNSLNVFKIWCDVIQLVHFFSTFTFIHLAEEYNKPHIIKRQTVTGSACHTTLQALFRAKLARPGEIEEREQRCFCFYDEEAEVKWRLIRLNCMYWYFSVIWMPNKSIFILRSSQSIMGLPSLWAVHATQNDLHCSEGVHFISSCISWGSNPWPWCCKLYAQLCELH